MMEQASDGIHTYDFEGNFIDVNSKLCEMLGYTREEMLRLNVRDLLPAEDVLAAPIRFKELRAGETLMAERSLRRKDGVLLQAEISGKMLEDDTLQAIIRDITERKRAEEALLESNEFNKQIIRSAREGIIVYDSECRYVVWNPFMEELTGLRAEEVIGKLPLDLFPFLRENGVEDLLRRALAGETVSTPDMPYSLPGTGKSGWLSSKYGPLYDAKGMIIGGLGVVHDITERKRAEEALRDSEQKLSLHARQTPLAFIEWNLEYEVTEWNLAAERIFGYTRQEALGKRATELIVFEEVREYVKQLWQEMLTRNESTRGINENVTKDGRIIYCDWHNTPLKGDGGEIVGFASLAQDITERKHSEEALRESEERFRQLAENISEVFWLSDRSTMGVIYVSSGYEKVWGRAPESLYNVPDSWLEAVHDEDRERVRVAVATKQTCGTYDEEYRIVRPDGSTRWIHDRAFPIADDAGEIHRIAGIAEDVTERKHSENALRTSEEQFFKAFNANPVPMSIINIEGGQYLYVNDSFQKCCGYLREELIGRSSLELNIYKTRKTDPALRKLEVEGRIEKEEMDFRMKSGKCGQESSRSRSSKFAAKSASLHSRPTSPRPRRPSGGSPRSTRSRACWPSQSR